MTRWMILAMAGVLAACAQPQPQPPPAVPARPVARAPDATHQREAMDCLARAARDPATDYRACMAAAYGTPAQAPPAPAAIPLVNAAGRQVDRAALEAAIRPAIAAYAMCLNRKGVGLALVSDERAEVIVRAAKGGCMGEWSQCVEKVRPFTSGPQEVQAILAAMDRASDDFLTFEVIRARAAARGQQVPAPRPAAPQPRPRTT